MIVYLISSYLWAIKFFLLWRYAVFYLLFSISFTISSCFNLDDERFGVWLRFVVYGVDTIWTSHYDLFFFDEKSDFKLFAKKWFLYFSFVFCNSFYFLPFTLSVFKNVTAAFLLYACKKFKFSLCFVFFNFVLCMSWFHIGCFRFWVPGISANLS